MEYAVWTKSLIGVGSYLSQIKIYFSLVHTMKNKKIVPKVRNKTQGGFIIALNDINFVVVEN